MENENLYSPYKIHSCIHWWRTKYTHQIESKSIGHTPNATTTTSNQQHIHSLSQSHQTVP